MVDDNTPDIGKDLICIHSVITRGLYVSLLYSQYSTLAGHFNTPKCRGFISYVKSLISVMKGHHDLEEKIMYPYLRYRMPKLPFDMLKAQHQDMMNSLNSIMKILEEPAKSLNFNDLLGKLNMKLKEIQEVWCSHIQLEEKHFTSDKINAVLWYDEQARLSRILTGYIHEHAGPDYLVVPFLIYNLHPDDRAFFSRKIPPALTQQLTSDAWMEKWTPMRTFMLP